MLGGAIKLAVTSSRKEMIKIIIQAAKILREIMGKVTRLNT